MCEDVLAVRPMCLDEVGIRIDYFHNALDAHLLRPGVDRSLLPSRENWFAFYQRDHARPIADVTSA